MAGAEADEPSDEEAYCPKADRLEVEVVPSCAMSPLFLQYGHRSRQLLVEVAILVFNTTQRRVREMETIANVQKRNDLEYVVAKRLVSVDSRRSERPNPQMLQP